MSNYPDGTGPNDPKAPWNEKECEHTPNFEFLLGSKLENVTADLVELFEYGTKCVHCKTKMRIKWEAE